MKLIKLDEMNRLVEICRILSTAPFYQKLGPGGVLAIYLTATEMNLPVMYCLNGGMHNIEGKVVLSSHLIHMMLEGAGFEIKFVEMNDKACSLDFIYPNKNRIENFKYTVEEAGKAGYFGIMNSDGSYRKKPKDNWLYHTKDMLFARTIASGGRKFAPRVIGNCYGLGELDNDGHIEPLSPDLPTIAGAESTQSPADNLQIAMEEHNKEHLALFVEKNKIVEGEPIYDYVVKIAKKKEIPTQKAIELAFINEEKFMKSFEESKKLAV